MEMCCCHVDMWCWSAPAKAACTRTAVSKGRPERQQRHRGLRSARQGESPSFLRKYLEGKKRMSEEQMGMISKEEDQ